MSRVEKQAKELRRRSNIQQAVVLALYGTTVITIATLAPQVLQVLKHVDPDMHKKRKPAYRIQQALTRLEARQLLQQVETPSGWSVQLTSQGRKYADRLHMAEKIVIRKPRKWDGRWRIIIFDVWERRRNVRDQLRRMLRKAGFKRIQDSVWVHPYDCEELLTFLRADLRLGKGILYIIAEGIENDTQLRKCFD